MIPPTGHAQPQLGGRVSLAPRPRAIQDDRPGTPSREPRFLDVGPPVWTIGIDDQQIFGRAKGGSEASGDVRAPKSVASPSR
jgi:hypothetical protein